MKVAYTVSREPIRYQKFNFQCLVFNTICYMKGRDVL